jgi:hypothetical protein
MPLVMHLEFTRLNVDHLGLQLFSFVSRKKDFDVWALFDMGLPRVKLKRLHIIQYTCAVQWN